MEQVKKIRPYIYVSLLIVFSSFEFFFRSNIFLPILSVVALTDAVIHKYKINTTIALYILLISLLYLIQGAFLGIHNINGIVIPFINLVGLACIASIAYKDFIRVFTNIIFVIALYSLIIYLICLNTSIYDYMYNHVAVFDSINVDRAVFDGGGKNFIIYNFQTDFISKAIGASRNCGPFWEPGMFAVFVLIALFFNLFLIKKGKLIKTIILIAALISTFSTGGYIGGVFIFLLYIINTGFKLRNIFMFIPVAICVTIYVANLEYIGEKTREQFRYADTGSDQSRYGAFLTQIDMIEASPIIGGESIQNYASSKTLASGTLWPIVVYGIPIALVYYIDLFLACRNLGLVYSKKRFIGVELYALILLLSFSQTILLNTIIICLMFCGLLIRNQKRCLKPL